ncbi:MAG: substrate-binding domain-containing protein [Methylomicrobium sp.]|nr:substrate-binding domain-containing protein [Methylomicrobium sp.]
MKKLKYFLGVLIFTVAFEGYAETVLRMSTTTSTENSGLLKVLNPAFEKRYGTRIEVLAVGTGKALKLAENGDVDVLLVHAPDAEAAFVAAGYGVNRKRVMFNDFVLVGPDNDNAGVKSAQTVDEALQKISKAKALFISRGDDSGTHQKELALWQKTGLKPQGEWYISAGQGMGAVLTMADEKQAYALSDRGTYLAMQAKLQLTVLYEGDEALMNPYHVMAVNPQRFPSINYESAMRYIEFLTGEEGQALIAGYKKQGQALFHPDAER